MSPDRYTHKDWPWWHRAITDLRLYLFIIALLSLYSIIIGTAARHNAQKSIQTLVACTTPHHACYDNSQKQAALFTKGIQRGNIYANYCAIVMAGKPHFTTASIEKCVIGLLSRDAKKDTAK